MGAENPTRPNDFSDTPPGETDSFTLDTNLYWNGGAPIPSDPAELVNYTDDLNSLVADPILLNQADIELPRWEPQSGHFGDGSPSIREAFEHLVNLFGRPAAGSPVIDASNSEHVPNDDILGEPRDLDAAPDIGAYEIQTSSLFELLIHPEVQAIWPGGSAAYTLTLQAAPGFAGSVNLQVVPESLPLGLTAAIQPPVLAAGETATLRLLDSNYYPYYPGIFHHVVIYASGYGTTSSVTAHLLVGGVRLYTPLIFKND
jgi:hypothetical protein